MGDRRQQRRLEHRDHLHEQPRSRDADGRRPTGQLCSDRRHMAAVRIQSRWPQSWRGHKPSIEQHYGDVSAGTSYELFQLSPERLQPDHRCKPYLSVCQPALLGADAGLTGARAEAAFRPRPRNTQDASRTSAGSAELDLCPQPIADGFPIGVREPSGWIVHRPVMQSGHHLPHHSPLFAGRPSDRT